MKNILNIVCYVPLAGMILIILMKREHETAVKWVANITGLIGFLVSVPLISRLNDSQNIDPASGFRFVYERPWIDLIGAKYKFGFDGISMLLVLLSTLLGAIAILSSWTAIGREEVGDGLRVLRGGAFSNYAWDVRCAYRGRDVPDDRFRDVGFRVVASPIP